MNIHLMYITVILLLVITQHFERKDLYNRIMCRDLAEYKGEKMYSVKSAHDRVLNKWRGRSGEDK